MEQLKLAQFYNSFEASKDKAIEALKEVDIEYSISDTHPTWSGYISLHVAVKREALDLVDELLEKGANLVKQGTDDGFTPLHVVMDRTLFRKFAFHSIEEVDSNEEQKDHKNKEMQKYFLMKTLLSKQVEINNTLNPENKYGLSHLHIASMVNHWEAVEFFVKAKKTDLHRSLNCNPHEFIYQNYIEKSGLQGCTALHCAVICSSVEAADILLRYGADIHLRNADGMSCVHLLVERIMDITDFMRMGKRTLCIPYLGDTVEKIESIIKSVLKTRASGEIFIDDTGLSAFHLACTLRDKSIVEDFLKKNVDVNMLVKCESKLWPGWTPLHFAACFSIEIMILLMQNGADINIKNAKGETALDLCAKRFPLTDISTILSTNNEYKNIVLTDRHTKLLNLLLVMNDYDKFDEFLQNLDDINLSIPLDSPIWAGYTLLHLSVSLNIKTILWEDFRNKLKLLGMAKEPPLEEYNCTEEEESLFTKRIDLCLHYGCNVDINNARGQSPIHLVFTQMRETAVIEKLLRFSKDNVEDENDFSHLHIACALGELEAVKRYLDKGANVNSRVKISFDWQRRDNSEIASLMNVQNVPANSTPLHVAVVFGQTNVMKYLLQNGADVYARDSLDLTPIHSVHRFDEGYSTDFFAILFEGISNLRNSVSKTGLTYLHVAAAADDPVAMKQLMLAEDVEVDCIVEANVQEPPFLARLAGKTPLHVAVESNAGSVIKILLKGGANLHVKNPEGISTIQYAINHLDDMGTRPFVSALKSGKCNVEGSGVTLLHVACGACNEDWVAELLNMGVDVDAQVTAEGKSKGATALYLTIESNIIFDEEINVVQRIVRLLLIAGADVTIDCKSVTPLHKLYETIFFDFSLDRDVDLSHDAYTRLLQIADSLLESQKSYDINPTDRQGFSHFHFACVRNKVDVVNKFLDHGVNVNHSIDSFTDSIGGFTPLHFALAHRSEEVAYLLLERGANVNAEDANGNKPLHVAIKKKCVDYGLIQTMLSFGADIHAKNLKNETPLYCLLRISGLTLERLEFFLIRGCSINILDTEDNEPKGIIGLAMCNATPTEWPMILKRLIQSADVKHAIRCGYNMIHSVVAIYNAGKLSVDDYFSTIEFLMSIGCELDQQDKEGKTALHEAVSFCNLEAIDALLQLGADVNIVDNKNECPLSNTLITDANASNQNRKMKVVNALARHIWKMQFIGLYVNDSNSRCLEEINQQIFFNRSTDLLDQSCLVELNRAKRTEIDPYLTLQDFLSESKAVLRYPTMGFERQAIVDQFFSCTNHLRQIFSELYGLLFFQYRKAYARMQLFESAKEAIVSICQIRLMDCLIDEILKYFTNNEMKQVIELAKQLFNRP